MSSLLRLIPFPTIDRDLPSWFCRNKMFNFLRLLQLSLLASAWWHVTKADEEAGLWAQRRAGNVHFGGASSFNDQVASGLDSSSSISSSSFRYPRQLPPSVQADQDEQYHPEAQDDSYYYQSDQPTPSTYSSGSFPISNLGRGSSSSAGNTFHLSSASSGGFGNMLHCIRLLTNLIFVSGQVQASQHGRRVPIDLVLAGNGSTQVVRVIRPRGPGSTLVPCWHDRNDRHQGRITIHNPKRQPILVAIMVVVMVIILVMLVMVVMVEILVMVAMVVVMVTEATKMKNVNTTPCSTETRR